jgi:hypothetical protein
VAALLDVAHAELPAPQLAECEELAQEGEERGAGQS